MKLLITVASMVIMFSNSLIYAAYPYSKWQGEKLNVEIINNTEHQFTFIAEKINDTEYSPAARHGRPKAWACSLRQPVVADVFA